MMMMMMKCTAICSLLLLLTTSISGFLTSPSPSPSSNHNLIILRDFPDGTGPSDYDAEDILPKKSVVVDDKEEDVKIRDALKRELLLLASVTNRGLFTNKDEAGLVLDLVSQLEALNPTANPAYHCEGEWDLCYSSTQLFRSSPFFQAIRMAVGDDNKQMAENGFTLHDRATSGSRIGRVKQILSSNELINELDLEVGVLPGLPFKIKGTVVTTASLQIVSDQKMELRLQGTKVKGSNIPLLNQLMEEELNMEIPVGEVYKTIRGDVPVIAMQTFYVDESMRITRDVDENIFVYTRP
ncbi:unnamed protein product [Cylindrotheca closterium]|uniref:Plastid lipid-associated protein/fibrillin conserved domain-containing protein n=1 Tax=Cylindrotheca closterium TaxID=2856 RepID=A0AAD2FGE8_9STRA|nr:unnamed protein product [Cylindrotheca closterium]